MNLMPPDAPPPSGALAVGAPLPRGGGGGGEAAGASSSRASAAAGGSWAVFFLMRGAGRLGVGTGVEVVGDVANRTDEPAIGGCAD